MHATLAGRKIVGPGPTGEVTVDPVFNRLNSLGTGNVTLVQLHKHLTDLAMEQNIPSMDIKVNVQSNSGSKGKRRTLSTWCNTRGQTAGATGSS